MKSAWKVVLSAVIAVIVIAVAAVGYGLIQGTQNVPVADQPAAVVKESVDTSTGTQVELLYFHRTDRCTSCNNAEQYARETLDRYFKDELGSGQITFSSIDYQQDKAMADQYNVKVQGLKIRSISGGQANTKDAPQIWSYVNDKEAYMDYLKTVIDKELR